MSDPHVYPEPPNGPLLAPAAAGAPDPTFTPIEQLAGQGQAGRTMFIRVAMSGADCPGAISPTAPNFYLRADSGDPVLVNDHAPAPNQTYPIFHRPAHDLGDYIGEGSIFLEDHNVFRIEIAIADPYGRYDWRLGIWNNDTAASRRFVWVVSASQEGAGQPWIHAAYYGIAPIDLRFEAIVGRDPAKATRTIAITNFGTAPSTVSGVSPSVPAPFAISGSPLTISPNETRTFAVQFETPSAPGDILPQVFRLATNDKTDFGPFSKDHNTEFSLAAHIMTGRITGATLRWTMATPGSDFDSAVFHEDRFMHGMFEPTGPFNEPFRVGDYAYRARRVADGNELWTFRGEVRDIAFGLNGFFAASPNGGVYLHSGIGQQSLLYALDADTGHERWPPIGIFGRLVGSPVVVGTRLLSLQVEEIPVEIKANGVIRTAWMPSTCLIDANTGALVHTVDFPPGTTPAIVPQSETECWFIETTIDSFDVTTLQLQKDIHQRPFPGTTAWANTSDRMYFASASPANVTEVAAIDKHSWTTKWSANVPDHCFQLFAGEDVVIAAQLKGQHGELITFRALDTRNGSELWNNEAENVGDRPGLGVGLFVRNVFVTQIHNLHWETVGIDVGTGQRIFRVENDGRSGWIIANDSFVVSCHHPNILGLEWTSLEVRSGRRSA